MSNVVFFVMGCLIFSKLLDVLSTLRLLRDPRMETNPIARKIMLQFGLKGTVWFIFLVVVLIVLTSGVVALYQGAVFQIAFILLGSLISVIQGAVAYTNWTGEDTLLSNTIRRLYSALSRNFSHYH